MLSGILVLEPVPNQVKIFFEISEDFVAGSMTSI